MNEMSVSLSMHAVLKTMDGMVGFQIVTKPVICLWYKTILITFTVNSFLFHSDHIGNNSNNIIHKDVWKCFSFIPISLQLPKASFMDLSNVTIRRRKWQPTPVFLPKESCGQGSLVGCCPWGRTESDMTEAT